MGDCHPGWPQMEKESAEGISVIWNLTMIAEATETACHRPNQAIFGHTDKENNHPQLRGTAGDGDDIWSIQIFVDTQRAIIWPFIYS